MYPSIFFPSTSINTTYNIWLLVTMNKVAAQKKNVIRYVLGRICFIFALRSNVLMLLRKCAFILFHHWLTNYNQINFGNQFMVNDL